MKETKRKRDLTESTADNTQEPKKPMHPGRGLKVRLPDDVGTHPYHRNVPSAPRAKRDQSRTLEDSLYLQLGNMFTSTPDDESHQGASARDNDLGMSTESTDNGLSDRSPSPH